MNMRVKNPNLLLNSNDMSVIKVPTNFNIDVEFEIPEFYRRLISLLIDVLLQYFYLRIASSIFESIQRSSGWGVDSQYNLQGIWMIFMIPILIYHPLMEI